MKRTSRPTQPQAEQTRPPEQVGQPTFFVLDGRFYVTTDGRTLRAESRKVIYTIPGFGTFRIAYAEDDYGIVRYSPREGVPEDELRAVMFDREFVTFTTEGYTHWRNDAALEDIERIINERKGTLETRKDNQTYCEIEYDISPSPALAIAS